MIIAKLDTAGMKMTYGYISTKWPAMVVRGNRVTPEQANEIIVRMTSPWELIGNDKEWEIQVSALFGVTTERFDGDFARYWREVEASNAALRHVHTEYLTLSGRIYSAMIGGAYGWCDWDGSISSAYNVGKWPSVEELGEQWADVARAFPYLSLTVQVLDGELPGQVELPELVAEWTISDGSAVLSSTPGAAIDVDAERASEWKSEWDRWFASDYRERHVSLSRLTEAVTQVRRSVKNVEADSAHE